MAKLGRVRVFFLSEYQEDTMDSILWRSAAVFRKPIRILGLFILGEQILPLHLMLSRVVR